MAARIKARRERIGLTQRELAERVGVGTTMIARIEIARIDEHARRPSLDLLERLADVFGCRVVDLLAERPTRKARPAGTRPHRRRD